MNSPSAKQLEVLNLVAAWADRFPCIRRIYIFGSFARGISTPNDIDIAVDYTDNVRTELQCYSDVNARSIDLEQSVRGIVPVRVGWTGLAALRDGYDQTAWISIHAGRVVHCCGKAQMIWTEPKPQPEHSSTEPS